MAITSLSRPLKQDPDRHSDFSPLKCLNKFSDSYFSSLMGNCVLVRRDQDSEPIKDILVWEREKEKEIGRICSLPTINHVPSSSPPQLFSKGDEMFFDSQPWLDSDNEDFFSVNGDNTPSCCSTPTWRPNATETPPVEPSPKDAKKQLIDLFRESFNSEQERSSIANLTSNHQTDLVQMEANDKKQPIISSRRSGKSAQSTPCCIPVPKLVRSLSLGEKKKWLLSPCHGGGRVRL